MSRQRWFLPETPDVLGLLRGQLAVTIEGLDAFAAWAGGDPSAAAVLRDAEHRGDVAKRALLGALRAAFVTPLEPEDVFALSRGVDWILEYAGDLVSESEVLACPPDAAIAEMAGLLGQAAREIDRALANLGTDDDAATDAADAAIGAEAKARERLLPGHGGSPWRRGPQRADRPPRALSPLLADRRDGDRRRRARRVRGREAELITHDPRDQQSSVLGGDPRVGRGDRRRCGPVPRDRAGCGRAGDDKHGAVDRILDVPRVAYVNWNRDCLKGRQPRVAAGGELPRDRERALALGRAVVRDTDLSEHRGTRDRKASLAPGSRGLSQARDKGRRDLAAFCGRPDRASFGCHRTQKPEACET